MPEPSVATTTPATTSDHLALPGAPTRVSFAKIREPLEVPNLLDLTDALDVSLFKLKPRTVYSVYASGQRSPVVQSISERTSWTSKPAASIVAYGRPRDAR